MLDLAVAGGPQSGSASNRGDLDAGYGRQQGSSATPGLVMLLADAARLLPLLLYSSGVLVMAMLTVAKPVMLRCVEE